MYRLFPSRTKKKTPVGRGARRYRGTSDPFDESRRTFRAPFKRNRWTSTFVRRKSFLGTVEPATTSLRHRAQEEKELNIFFYLLAFKFFFFFFIRIPIHYLHVNTSIIIVLLVNEKSVNKVTIL